MSRSFGATSFTTRLPIAISPSVISSSPAIIRSSVDLPQPDGPTSTQNSPSSILMSTPCTTWVVPKDFLTRERVTDAMVFSLRLCGDRQTGRPDRLEALYVRMNSWWPSASDFVGAPRATASVSS